MARLLRFSPAAREPEPVVANSVSPALRQRVTRAFALVGEAMASATHALLAADRELAKRVVARDAEIDALIDDIVSETEAQLVASDYHTPEARRDLLTLLRVLPEVERSGDLAEHVARSAARGLGTEMSPRSRGLVERMGEVASSLWRDATDVVLDGRVEAAAAIEDVDDELDELHVALTAELTSGSMALPIAVEVALLARFLERFGDHCVNLAHRSAGRGGAD